ncbi:MAG TPA: type II toxin-antitoxin system VapC family toxin [Dehalococcoidia bacterium]|nr:type II toxin-antitoxin system VapC family toxin [Dehalococcoidia bacterium]
MTSGRYLLDTGIVASLFRGDAGVQDRIAGSEEIFVSSITLGELFYGAFKSQRTEDELEKIGEFAQVVRVLDCDADTEVYGRIKTALRVKGRPIPENDIWIAATAMQHELSLAMRDSHFEQVDGLTFASW